MAKKTECSETDIIDRIYKSIEKDYGEDVMIDGNSAVQEEKVLIPWSPAMDIITGSIEEGSWVGITGNEKMGKTTSALSLAASAQQSEFGSRPVFYSKVEGRLSTHHLKGIQGLRLEKPFFNIIQSREGKILTAQENLKILAETMRTVKRGIFIIDSISALCDEKEMEGGIGTETRGGGAKIFSQFCSLMSNVVPVHKHIVIGITHLISNTSGMGAMYVEKAARRWRYQCDYQVRAQMKEDWKSGDKLIGLKVKWQCKTSPINAPGMTIESYIRFGVGIDRLFEAINLAVSVGLIKKAGAWLSLTFMEHHLDLLGVSKWDEKAERMVKAQGSENIYNMLKENPKWANALTQSVLRMAGALAGNEEV